MSNGNKLFQAHTPLGHQAELDYTTFDIHIILRGKRFGWARPSAFEIRESVEGPSEVRKSEKELSTYIYVKPVGMAGGTQWYTVSLLRTTDNRVVSSYNATSYAQKGPKVWP